MLKTLRQIQRTGIVTEPVPAPDPTLRIRAVLEQRILGILGRALAIRMVDAGSCNGCELEVNALTNPIYNIEGLGVHFVASPRHADLLLVSGPVTTAMRDPLLRVYEATPDPKLVVAIGDCGRDGGVFGCGGPSLGAVANVIPVDVVVPGCPPSPNRLLAGILAALAELRGFEIK